MNPERLAGVALFLPVPVVLALFVRTPLGLAPSLALGVALMATHRLYARPWVVARAGRRCLWCAAAATATPLAVRDPLGPAPWSACGPQHSRSALALVGWAQRHARGLKVAILGGLLVLLGTGLACATGLLPAARNADAVAVFQAAVATGVLPLSILGPRASAPAEAASPFPLHIQALVGSATVVWLFRLVGALWLFEAARHALSA